MGLKQFLRSAAELLEVGERYEQSGEDDPMKFVDEVLKTARNGLSPAEQAGTGAWWELFGLDAKPTDRATLDSAWRAWARRHHPDTGGNAPAFRHMRELYEHQGKKLA